MRENEPPTIASSAGEPALNVVEVSPEMTTLLAKTAGRFTIPPNPVALIATLEPQLRALQVEPEPNIPSHLASLAAGDTLFLIQREAMIRIGGRSMVEGGAARFHLNAELGETLLALRDPDVSEAARLPYRLAKSIEFLCQAIRDHNAGALAPLSAAGQLSREDTRRVLAARQFIQDHASEKLTLDLVGRRCGLSRSKLTRGYKELFDRTVAQDIAGRRLELARLMLLTTDLPISSVGLEAGYLNNASFARAFGRRFGQAPSMFRSAELAA